MEVNWTRMESAKVNWTQIETAYLSRKKLLNMSIDEESDFQEWLSNIFPTWSEQDRLKLAIYWAIELANK